MPLRILIWFIYTFWQVITLSLNLVFYLLNACSLSPVFPLSWKVFESERCMYLFIPNKHERWVRHQQWTFSNYGGCGFIQLLVLGGRTKYFSLGQIATKFDSKLAGVRGKGRGDILKDPCEAREKTPVCQRGSGRNSSALPSLLSQNPCDS